MIVPWFAIAFLVNTIAKHNNYDINVKRNPNFDIRVRRDIPGEKREDIEIIPDENTSNDKKPSNLLYKLKGVSKTDNNNENSRIDRQKRGLYYGYQGYNVPVYNNSNYGYNYNGYHEFNNNYTIYARPNSTVSYGYNGYPSSNFNYSRQINYKRNPVKGYKNNSYNTYPNNYTYQGLINNNNQNFSNRYYINNNNSTYYSRFYNYQKVNNSTFNGYQDGYNNSMYKTLIGYNTTKNNTPTFLENNQYSNPPSNIYSQSNMYPHNGFGYNQTGYNNATNGYNEANKGYNGMYTTGYYGYNDHNVSVHHSVYQTQKPVYNISTTTPPTIVQGYIFSIGCPAFFKKLGAYCVKDDDDQDYK